MHEQEVNGLGESVSRENLEHDAMGLLERIEHVGTTLDKCIWGTALRDYSNRPLLRSMGIRRRKFRLSRKLDPVIFELLTLECFVCL